MPCSIPQLCHSTPSKRMPRRPRSKASNYIKTSKDSIHAPSSVSRPSHGALRVEHHTCAAEPHVVCWCNAQVQAWSRDLHCSQLHMRNLTASRPTEPSGDLSSAGDAIASAPADAQGATDSGSAAASPAKPLIEIRAGLGELSLFVSGRVCDDWWPPEASAPALHALIHLCFLHNYQRALPSSISVNILGWSAPSL